jgi:hypothetical protein
MVAAVKMTATVTVPRYPNQPSRSPHLDGRGLPPGKVDYVTGKLVYAGHCAACHGARASPDLHNMSASAQRRLIAGRGTLTSQKPVLTVDNYWPYATTLVRPRPAEAISSSMSTSPGCRGVCACAALACVTPFTETGVFGGGRVLALARARAWERRLLHC